MMLKEDIIGEEATGAFIQLFAEIYKGDSAAIDLALQMLYVVHVWDDLIDEDKTLNSSHINLAFRYVIYDIPMNKYMSRELNTLWLNCYNQWQAANEMELKKEQYEKAYMLRAQIYSCFIGIAANIFGVQYAESISYKVYSFYGENFEKYKEEMNDA